VTSDQDLVTEAKRIIDLIANRPRFAGSADEADARAECARLLARRGFEVHEREFEFSEWPGRFGVPLMSAVMLGSVLLMCIGAMRWGVPFGTPPGFWLGSLSLVFLERKHVRATRGMSWRRTKGINLEATRGDPKVWLVAHLDSKSQTVPILVRSASSTAITVIFLATAIATQVVRWFSWENSFPWLWIALVATIAALPSLFCFIRNESAGALDNASGVAAVLLAAQILPREEALGVLITTAEELDLAGAREWAAGRGRGITLINCDTVDDTGSWRCMYRSRPHAAILASQRAATRLSIELRVGKIIPGILTDSIAFDLAGLSSVTISRGTLGTLARLHTPRDTSGRVTGAGAATAGRLLADIVEEMH
jgi:hypothetical protein